MSRYLIILRDQKSRNKAHDWIKAAPDGWRMEMKETKRTIPQNDRMWALLSDISTQLVWHGRRYSTDDWKDYFTHALNGGRWMPAEDGGMVPIGHHTSDMGRQEHSMLQDIIEAFGERHGVIFGDQQEDAA